MIRSKLAARLIGCALTAPVDGVVVSSAMAEPATSTFHRMKDGNGNTIPCRCAINGRLVPLGTTACLQMPAGLQVARCDLAANVTSWTPTGVPCATSQRPMTRKLHI